MRAWASGKLWLFDPFEKRIAGSRLVAGEYVPIERLPDDDPYPSDVLGLELRAEGDDLRIHDPVAGEDLLGSEEEQAGCLAAEDRAAAAEAEIARLMGLLQQRDLTSQPE